ncbi:MAG: transcriptional regulator, LacI family [Conexibacter sp.]|nr:transcriptional regulator, LacI family [Conexibacter sp.]
MATKRTPTKSAKPSIRDIAREAGVSITTVSHALNDKGRLPQATRDRVRELADRLGYAADPKGRGLATGRTMLLAIQASGSGSHVLVPEAAYFVELINGAAQRAFELGYGLVLAPPSTSAEAIHRLSADGAIIVDPTGKETLLDELRSSGRPVVTTGRLPSAGDDDPWVDNDHVAGAQLALDHLASIGCERPALLTTTASPSYVSDAVRGYRAWCKAHGVVSRIARVRGASPQEAARRAVGTLLDGPDAPDALYATLDLLAAGALEAADERGVAVPEELALVATTDSAMVSTARPSVTALDLEPAKIGARAIELLVALIEDEATPERHAVIPVGLTRRASTDRSTPSR